MRRSYAGAHVLLSGRKYNFDIDAGECSGGPAPLIAEATYGNHAGLVPASRSAASAYDSSFMVKG